VSPGRRRILPAWQVLERRGVNYAGLLSSIDSQGRRAPRYEGYQALSRQRT
jgi:hypothetical protein